SSRRRHTRFSRDWSSDVCSSDLYAREQNMARNLLEGLDIHSVTAEMLNIPRDAAKRINFGIIYGIGAKSLAEQLHIPEEQAAERSEERRVGKECRARGTDGRLEK